MIKYMGYVWRDIKNPRQLLIIQTTVEKGLLINIHENLQIILLF